MEERVRAVYKDGVMVSPDHLNYGAPCPDGYCYAKVVEKQAEPAIESKSVTRSAESEELSVSEGIEIG